jgi:hypothetical protein
MVSYTTWVVAAGCAVQEDGRTALHRAIEGGDVECVRLLLDRGTDIDLVDVSSWLVVCTYRGAYALRAVCGECVCCQCLWVLLC